MKTVIICASTHHGNTKKVVDAIANKFDVDVVDATSVTKKDLSDYDLIGFASGIYGGKMHQSVIKFAKANLPMNKRVFYIMTSALGKDFSRSMKSGIEGKNAKEIGAFTCQGYNTFGPFKIVGGTAKGHPDDNDLKNAVAFFEKISSRLSK